MCAGLFLIQLDVTVVNVTLPRLRESLGAEVGGLQWVVDGYALALASLMLAGGTLGDRYGHRRVVLGGLAVFGLGSLGCGVAPGTGALVEDPGWRWVFLVNVPIVALALLATVLVVPDDRGAPGRRLDLPGLALAAALLGLVTFAFIGQSAVAAFAAAAALGA
jgi:MFS family permease